MLGLTTCGPACCARLLALVLLLLPSVFGQEIPHAGDESADSLLMQGRSAAQSGNLYEARETLLRGRRLFADDERFAVELAGVAFLESDFAEARRWLRRAPQSRREDAYVQEFLGTLLLLDGQTEAAIVAWAPIGKPRIASTGVGSGLEAIIRPQLASSATRFPAGTAMQQKHYLLAQRRIAQLGVCGTAAIQLEATANEEFHPRVRCVERPGIARSPIAAAVMLSRGLAYQAGHLHAPNLRGSAVSLKSMARWDPRKRRLWAEASAPLLGEAGWRLRWYADARQEYWQMLAPASPGVQQAFQLQRVETGIALGAVLGPRATWENDLALSYRDFNHVQSLALGDSRLDTGYSLRYGHRVQADLVRMPLRRFVIDTTAEASFERYPALRRNLWRGTAELRATWHPRETSTDGRVQLRLRTGRLHGDAPLTELFAMGLERDGAIPLRAHIGTRDGHKGSALFGDRYWGTSLDVRKLIFDGGALRLAVAPFLDSGWIADPLARYGSGRLQFDTGVQLVASSPGGTEFRLAWGWDLRQRRRSFYAWSEPFP